MEKTILRECSIHGLTKFVLRKDGKYRCRKCASEAVQKRRIKVKEKAIEYKGGKCERCGYDKCSEALEFHHPNPDSKDFGISQKGYCWSWAKIKIELDKCILLCANCHREIHHEIKCKEKEKIEKEIKEKKERVDIPPKKTCSFNKIQYIDIELIKKDIENGLKQPEIAVKYNISVCTLKRFIWSHGIYMGGRKPSRRKK